MVLVTLAQLLELPEPKRRRCLVLVNPFGGAGKAVEIFQDKVAPMMAEANVAFNLVITGLPITIFFYDFYSVITSIVKE